MAQPDLTPAQQTLMKTLADHGKAELVDLDVDATLATMTGNPYIFPTPTLSGREGVVGVREFYRRLMEQLPQDFKLAPITRTIGNDRIATEYILTFTHDVTIDWLLPGLAPTGRRVETPMVVIFTFKNDKLESERLYWDQASMLMQLGLLKPDVLPIVGSQNVKKLQELMEREL